MTEKNNQQMKHGSESLEMDDKDNSFTSERRNSKKPSSVKNSISSKSQKDSFLDNEKTVRPKTSRPVKFSSTVHICLILSRDELRHLDLYWKPSEYAAFKHDAVQELRVHLTSQGITAKEAIFQMYQPHDHERIEWMRQYQDLETEKELDDTDKESNSTRSPSVGDNDSCDSDNIYTSDEDDKIQDNKRQSNRLSSTKTEPPDNTGNSSDEDDNALRPIVLTSDSLSSLKREGDKNKGGEKLGQHNSKNSNSNRPHGWALPWLSTKKSEKV